MARAYPLVARLFSVCFVVVGLWLLVSPDSMARLLNWSAGLLGLSGTIKIVSDSLDYALSLSLMSAITVLADTCARHPQRREPYVALMTAKIVSTAAFALLAFQVGTAWLLPMGTDAFVAVALWWARRAWLSANT